ncbi:MAG: hypothetical protein ACRDQ5_16855 [Sciscionella sp.]
MTISEVPAPTVDWRQASDAELVLALTDLQAKRREIYATMLVLLREVDNRDLASSLSYPDLVQLQRHLLGIPEVEAKRRLKLARAITPPCPVRSRGSAAAYPADAGSRWHTPVGQADEQREVTSN